MKSALASSPSSRKFKGRRYLLAVALSTLFAPPAVHAAAKTWTGTTNATWNTPANWGGANPVTGDSLVFTSAVGAGGLILSDNLMTPGTFSIAGITFNSGSGAYVINPATSGTNGFTLTGNVTNSSTSLQTINDLIATTAVRTFTMTTGGGNITLGGVVSGSGGGILTAGAGTLTLGATGNSYTGTTTVATGTTLSLSGTLTGGTAITVSGTGVLSETSTGGISGAASITHSSSGASTLAGTNTYTGATALSAGTLNLTGSLGATAINVSGTGVLSESSTGGISGAASITHSSSGASTLAGTNTYTGVTAISAGTLNLTGSLGSTAITVSGTGVLSESSTGGIGGTASITYTSSGNSTLAGTNAYSGTTTVSAGTLNLTGSLTGATAISVTAGNFTQGGAGVISSATATLAVSNTGTSTLSGTNTYGGATTVSLGGTLNLDFSAATGPASASQIIKSGNTVNLGGGSLVIKGGGAGATNTQTLGTTAFTANTASTISHNLNGGTALNVAFGGFTRNAQSSVDITLPASGVNLTTTSAGGVNGILGNGNDVAYATANGGTTWLAKTGVSSPFALSALTTYSTGNANYTTGNNVDVTNGDAPASGVTVNTLRFNAASTGLTLAGVNIVNTGGILITPSSAGTITGGTLTSKTAAAEVIVHNYGTLTIGSIIANANAGANATNLTFTGTGTTTLSGANSYTGITGINKGTVKLSGAGTLGNGTAPLTIANAGKLQLNGVNASVGALNSVITVAGLATPTIENANLTGATLTVTNGGTYAGVLQNGTGGGGLGLTNTSGTLTLSGTNTYSGATLISGGAISIAAATNLPSGSAVTLSGGGALNMSGTMTLGNNVTVANGQSGTLKTVGAVTGTLSGNYSGVAGTLTLDASSGSSFNGFVITSTNGPAAGSVVNILGTTTANSVQVGSSASLATQAFFANSKVSITATGSGQTFLAYGNGVANPNAQFGALDGGNATTLVGFDNRTGTVTITGTANGNYSGIIFNGNAATGGATVIKNGSSTQTFSGANTYSGPTNINAGTLTLGVGGSLASTSTITIASPATLNLSGSASNQLVGTSQTGTLNINGTLNATTNQAHTLYFSTISMTSGTLANTFGANTSGFGAFYVPTNKTITANGANTISGTGVIGIASGAALTLNTPLITDSVNVTGTLGQGLSGTAGGFTKSGLGTVTVSGANIYTGVTTISGGILSTTTLAAGGSNSGIGAAVVAGGNLVLNGGTLQLPSTVTTAQSTNRLFTIGTAGATLDASGTSNGAMNFTGTTAILFSSSAAPASLTLTGAGTGTAGGSLTPILGNSGTGANITSLTKSGIGTWTVGNANTYTGVTTINAGILSVGTLAPGSSNSSIGASTSAAANLVLGGGTLQYTGASVSTDRNFTLTAATSSTIEVASGAANLTISGASANTSGALTKSGSGTLIFTGANAHTGTTTISGGSLQLGSGSTTGALSPSSAIANNANLTINRTNDVVQGTDFSSASITGSGSFTQAGSGTTTLNVANGYTGGTTVSAGTLMVNNTTGSGTGNGPVSVASGATLGGSGFIGGNTTILGGGILSPGNSPGTMTYTNSNLAWSNNGNYNWQVLNATHSSPAAGTDYDTVNITGTGILDLSGLGGTDFNINLWTLSSLPNNSGNASNWDATQAHTWTLVSTTHAITGFDAANFTINNTPNVIAGTGGFSNSLLGGTFSVALTDSSTDLSLVFTPGGPNVTVTSVTNPNLFVLQNADPSTLTATANFSNANGNAATINTPVSSPSGLLTGTPTSILAGPGSTATSSITLAPGSTATNTTEIGATLTYPTTQANTGSAVATVNVRIGNAPLATSNSFENLGATLTAATPISGTAYENLASNTSGQASTDTFVPALHSTATILTYTNSTGDDTAVNMAWRSRKVSEASLGETGTLASGYLISDVVNLTGMTNVTGVDNAPGQTDVFVLQMSYDDALLNGFEIDGAAARHIFLAYNDGSAWVNAVLGNKGDTIDTSDFVNGPYTPGDEDHLGRWGVNTADHTVWAVLNHNSEFAVIPEPSTLVLGGIALLGFAGVGLRRRRQRV